MIKTLIFCTSYAPNPHMWQFRHRRWVDAIVQSGIVHDQILIVDDGSPCLPDWPGLTVVSSDVCATPEAAPVPGGVMIHHFTERLGRPSLYDFPGWHRSFAFAVLYGQAHGFGRVIHIESDAFLMTRRVRAYLGGLETGWVALFCAKYDFPEIAIQAAAGDGVARMAAWAKEPYANMVGKSHEMLIPFTKVERGFLGDRYGEHLSYIPRNIDYAAQVEICREPEYYWWLGPDHPEPVAVAVTASEIGFAREGNMERVSKINHSARRINALANALGAKRYLEIGVESGVTFLDVEIEHKTAVDPNFLLDVLALAGEKTRFHAETSDRFFAQTHDGSSFDIVFVDGLHVFEQVVRDLSNTLLSVHAGSVIVLDDTWPSDVFSAIPDYQETMSFRAAAGLTGDDWHGDVYKAVFYIHDFWPGLNYVTVAGSDNPQTLLWRSNKFVRQPRFDSLERISRLDYYDLIRNRELMRERTEEEALALCLGELGMGPAA